MRIINYLSVFILLQFSACSSLVLAPADFSWPIESVLEVDKDGFVKEERHSVSFNTKNLFLEETGDSLAYGGKNIRIIRDVKGYFFITAENFKNVYVFMNAAGELHIENKIIISETTPLKKPVLNQRPPYVELIDGDLRLLLTNEGITDEDKNNE